MHIVRASFFYHLENFKDHTLIIPEILEFIELHTYKFGLVSFTGGPCGRVGKVAVFKRS